MRRMDRSRNQRRQEEEYPPYGEESENYIPGFHSSSNNEEYDDDADDEILFLKDVTNNPTDGVEHSTADMDILRSLLAEEDDGNSTKANLIQRSGVESIVVREGNDGNIDTFETAEQHNAKVTYLHNYKRMIEQQELEQMATTEHLLPLFEGIRNLGNNGTNNAHTQNFMESYSQNNGNNKQQQQSFRDLPILTYNQMKRALCSLEGPSSTTSCPSLSQEIIQTDEQLLMTLRELVSISVRYHDEQRRMSLGLTFPEFLQCYRVVVNGMQILEMIPNSTLGTIANQTKIIPNHIRDNSNSSSQSQWQLMTQQTWIPKLRTTTTSRVLAMIRTFTIPAEEVSDYSTTNYSNTTIDTIIAAAELRNILTAKDQQLAQMITTHEEEIHELAHQIYQVTMQHRRRSYAINAFWILCVITTLVYALREGVNPFVTRGNTNVTDTSSNISTTTMDNNQLLRQQQNDRLTTIESIIQDLSDGVPIMNVHLDILKEAYENATQLLKQINNRFPNSTMCHSQGSFHGALPNATYMEWCQLQQKDTCTLEANSTPPVTSKGIIHKKSTSTNQSIRSKNKDVLKQRYNQPLTLVPFTILKSNLPYIAATTVLGFVVTGITIYQPGMMTLFFHNIFRIFFRL